MNEYFEKKLKNSVILDLFSEEELALFLQDVEEMSELGVQSKEDEKLAMSILFHVPDVINDIKDPSYQLTKSDLKLLNKELFDSKTLLTTDNIFCAIADAAKNIGIPLSKSADKECFAYPQKFNIPRFAPSYDVNKWISAAREIAKLTQLNSLDGIQMTYDQAFDKVTYAWNKNEAVNFRNWLKFYTEGSFNKYPKLANMNPVKTAQFFSPNGVYVPQAELPQPEQRAAKPDPSEIKVRIEGIRSKIISRLSSAEKMLTSIDGQEFAGDDQEIMLKLLQDLKRKIQTVNRKNVYSSIFKDLIIRAGNYMKDIHDSEKGKVFFYKIAQIPGIDSLEQPLDEPSNYKSETKQVFKELRELLKDGVYDKDDEGSVDLEKQNELEKQKPLNVNIAPPGPSTLPAQVKNPPVVPGVLPDGSVPMPPPTPATASIDYDIVVLAQEAIGKDVPIVTDKISPQEGVLKQKGENLDRFKENPVINDKSKNNLVVNEEDIQKEPEESLDDVVLEDNTDDVIENALQNITIHDAISRLEILVGLYKKREVPRQLSILDIMMDQLGLSSYFPDLGEAMAKALESSQYISTRLENVLNKLKGSVESPDADDWISNQPKVSPETAVIQKKLEQEAEKDKELRELRKQRSNEKIIKEKDSDDVSPIGSQSKVLEQPINIEKEQPLQVR